MAVLICISLIMSDAEGRCGVWEGLLKREGTYVCLPWTHVFVQQKPTPLYKAVLLQLTHTHTHTRAPSADSHCCAVEANTTL